MSWNYLGNMEALVLTLLSLQSLFKNIVLDYLGNVEAALWISVQVERLPNTRNALGRCVNMVGICCQSPP